jgi:uroporphyrinogen-III synthase
VAEANPSPLAGKRVVVTRAAEQSTGFCDALRALGADPVVVPLIKIVPIEDFAPLDAALARLLPRDWIILTSQNAVPPLAVCARLLHKELLGNESSVQIAVVGPATENAASAAGLKVAYVAVTHDGVSLAQELGERLRGRQVLLPRSNLAGTDMPAALHRFGAEVIEVVAYRTEPERAAQAELQSMLATRCVDAMVCFSPSAVHSLANLLGPAQIGALQEHLVFAAIGEVTAHAFRGAGVRIPLVAADATPEAVVTALSEYFAKQAQRDFAGAKKS